MFKIVIISLFLFAFFSIKDKHKASVITLGRVSLKGLEWFVIAMIGYFIYYYSENSYRDVFLIIATLLLSLISIKRR